MIIRDYPVRSCVRCPNYDETLVSQVDTQSHWAPSGDVVQEPKLSYVLFGEGWELMSIKPYIFLSPLSAKSLGPRINVSSKQLS